MRTNTQEPRGAIGAGATWRQADARRVSAVCELSADVPRRTLAQGAARAGTVLVSLDDHRVARVALGLAKETVCEMGLTAEVVAVAVDAPCEQQTADGEDNGKAV